MIFKYLSRIMLKIIQELSWDFVVLLHSDIQRLESLEFEENDILVVGEFACLKTISN